MSSKYKNSLQVWEISIIKAMIWSGKYNNQEILAHFSRPIRSINPARIAEIASGERHDEVAAASEDQLADFLDQWPNIDPKTGLDVKGDELLIKAREAMIAGVHIFNGANLIFRSELFVVAAIIAWTYLLHYWYSRKGVDYRYRDRNGTVELTKDGAERYWDLSKCLRYKHCPVEGGVINNLNFLIGVRNEIEHRMTDRIDLALVPKLQACCINFDIVIKTLFGHRYSLEKELPIALQLGSFEREQRELLKNSDLPQNIESFIDAYEHKLSNDQIADPAYQHRVAFVRVYRNRVSGTDEIVEFIGSDSTDDPTIRAYIKLVEPNRYTATQICKKMQQEGFSGFTMPEHVKLWKSKSAKDPAKDFGKQGDYKNTWIWNEKWLNEVRSYCKENVPKDGA